MVGCDVAVVVVQLKLARGIESELGWLSCADKAVPVGIVLNEFPEDGVCDQ